MSLLKGGGRERSERRIGAVVRRALWLCCGGAMDQPPAFVRSCARTRAVRVSGA